MRKMCVSDVMITDVITVSVDTSFREVAARLDAHPGALPVLDVDGTLVGIVSASDLLAKQRYPEQRHRSWLSILPWRRRLMAKASGRTAGDLMTSPAITIHGSAMLAAAARLMVCHMIQQLPVLGPHDNLVGMVCRSNLIIAYLRSDADIRAEVLERMFGPGILAAPDSIAVRVHEGVVHLKGQLDHRSVVESADDLISDVDGVVAVVNDLRYRHDDSIRQTSRVSEPGATEAG